VNITNFTNNNSFIESLEYMKHKNLKIAHDYIFLQKYNKDNKINKNYITYNDYVSTEFIKTINKKYDLINIDINLRRLLTLRTKLIHIASCQLYYLFFLYSLIHLNKNGSIIMYIGNIINKPIADILIMGKKYFKNVSPYISDIHLWKFRGVFVVFSGFKGISNKDLSSLMRIADKLLKNDPTSLGFTINNNKMRKEHRVINPKNSKYQQIREFISLPAISSQYDFIRDFNNFTRFKKM
jgi:hypothetical protein